MALVSRVRTSVSRGWTSDSDGTRRTSSKVSASLSLSSPSIAGLPRLEIDGVCAAALGKSTTKSGEEDEGRGERVEDEDDVERHAVGLQARRQRGAARLLLVGQAGGAHRRDKPIEGSVVAPR